MKKQRTNEPLQLEGEIWKPIVGFEGLYEVSNFGRILSFSTSKYSNHKPFIMRQIIQGGYLRINLHKNGKSFYFFVHRLVYEAFKSRIPRFEHKGKGHGDEMLEINHKDENPLNNRLDNLELVTRTQNNKYGNRIKKAATAMSKHVYQYTKDLRLVKEWNSTIDCKYLGGYVQGAVASCCRGERKSHRGFIWSYVPL